ncbi:MAG: N-acetylmuramoyl-L-alanine amidase [Brevinematia bacterium]
MKVRSILALLVIITTTVSWASTITTFHLTNNLIEIFSFSESLRGNLSYDPYKAKITIRFGTNTLEFFENREFFIVNSNFVFPIVGGLIKTNYNYYLPLSVVDSIVSFLKLECKVLNVVTISSTLPVPSEFPKEESKTGSAKNTQVLDNASTTFVTNLDAGATDFVPIKFVIIDAGHGGKDPGAIHNGIKEKDLNLTYAKALSSELSKRLSHIGVDVILTRTYDVYLSLEQRAKIANDFIKTTKGYGVFISIHQNASPVKVKKGMEIYFISDQAVDDDTREVLAFENSFIPKEEIKKVSELEKIIGKIRSIALMEESKILSEKLSKAFLPSPPIKGGPFYVIKYIPIPSVLIEVGYISNPEDAKLITSENHIREISRRLSEGIVEFINEYNRTRGFVLLR